MLTKNTLAWIQHLSSAQQFQLTISFWWWDRTASVSRPIFCKLNARCESYLFFPDIFEGVVHVYNPVTPCEWALHSYIRSPVGDNGNFGVDLDIDGDRIIVGADAWRKFNQFSLFRLSFLSPSFYILQAHTRERPSSTNLSTTRFGSLRPLWSPLWASSKALVTRP